MASIFQSGRSFFDREVVFIGTNGLRPAVGGGNNDNFFHGESRVIRYDDHDKDDYDTMVIMITMILMATMAMIMKVKYHDFCKFRPPVENAQRIDNEHPCGNIRLRERENLKHRNYDNVSV